MGHGNGGGGDDREPLDSDNDGKADGVDDYPNDPDRHFQRTHTSDTLTVTEHSHVDYELNPSNPVIVEYEFVVKEGPAIDVIVMNGADYQFYIAGKEYEFLARLSTFDSSKGTVKGELPSEEYHIVVDNTESGKAAPRADVAGDDATVEFTLETAL